MSILLTTTGTQSTVTLDDLNGIELTHPVTNYDLLADFEWQKVYDSDDLISAIGSGYITVTANGVEVFEKADLLMTFDVDLSKIKDGGDGTNFVVEYMNNYALYNAITPGPQGPQGVEGVQGTQGPEGDTGSQGAQGPEGAGAQGPQGPEGNVGAQGAQGPEGDIGVQGPQGPEGSAGSDGPQGAQGPEGNVGAQGPEGNVGAQGPAGSAGAAGAQGPQGPEGNVGAQGPEGDTGAQGVQGPEGAAGGDGAQGAQGPEGDVGAQGPQGPEGNVGVQGAQGPEGDASTVPGPQGPQGVVGPQGVQGPQGPTGEAEIDSARVYLATQQSTTSETWVDIPNATVDITTTVEGHILAWADLVMTSSSTGGSEFEVRLVIDSENGDPHVTEPYDELEINMAFSYRTSSEYVPGTYTVKLQWRRLSGSLTIYAEDIGISAISCATQGAQGPVGVQGPQGPEGGPQGYQGPTGPTGIQGPQGPEGAGFQGPQGPTGVQGPAGGPQGPQGPIGPVGDGIVDSARVYSATRQSLTSGDWGDIPGATVDITTTVEAYIMAWADFVFTSSGAAGGTEAEYRFVVGSENGNVHVIEPYGDLERMGCFSFRTATQYVAGTYTIKLQWRRTTGTDTVYTEDIGISAISCGAEGAQGVQGPQGPEGGPQGVQGPTGPTGIQGPQGPEGAGFQGPQGPTGVQGPAGGPQGPQGPAAVNTGIHISIADDATFYATRSSTSWVVVRNFLFPGTTNIGTPSSFKARVGSAGGNPADIRLYDADNSNVIAQVDNFTGTATTVTDNSLTNLPSGEALFEIQVRGNTAANVYISYAGLLF